MVGEIAGLTHKPSKEDLKKMKNSGVTNLIPGVGNYNLNQRVRATIEENKDHKGKSWTNVVGEKLGPLLSMGLGAAAGASLDETNRLRGAVIGTGMAAIPAVLALAVAAATKRRSMEEQTEHDDSLLNAASNIVPGVGTYNMWKRLGASKNLTGE